MPRPRPSRAWGSELAAPAWAAASAPQWAPSLGVRLPLGGTAQPSLGVRLPLGGMAQPSRLALLLTLASALARVLAAQELLQSPCYAVAPRGGSVNITCACPAAVLGLYLLRSSLTTTQVIYYEDRREPTVDLQFQGRVSFSGSQSRLTITVQPLRMADSGAYTCQAVTNRTVHQDDLWGSGTIVVVTENPSQVANRCLQPQPPARAPGLRAELAVTFFILGLGLGVLPTCYLCARRAQVKKVSSSRDKDSSCVVYEDMSLSRCNTVSISSQYQGAWPAR